MVKVMKTSREDLSVYSTVEKESKRNKGVGCLCLGVNHANQRLPTRMALELSQLLSTCEFIVASRLAEVFVGFGAAFDKAGLETVGPIAHHVCGHGRQQRLAPPFAGNARQKDRQELLERLQRSLEADFPGRSVRFECRPCHHAAKEIVAEKMGIKLVANPLGSFAPQMVHL